MKIIEQSTENISTNTTVIPAYAVYVFNSDCWERLPQNKLIDSLYPKYDRNILEHAGFLSLAQANLLKWQYIASKENESIAATAIEIREYRIKYSYNVEEIK